MKASVLEAPQRSVVQEVPDPAPGEGEVLVQVKACGICASEFSTWAGTNREAVYPQILGHEASGVVMETGDRVTGVEVGQHVAMLPPGSGQRGDNLNGGLAERTIVPHTHVTTIPPGIEFSEAIVEPVGCLISGVERTRLRLADRVAVIGCGFMGLTLIQLLRLRGPKEIVAVDMRQEALDNANRFGADEAWLVEDINARGMLHHGGRWDTGFDAVYETAGTQSSLDLATTMTRVHGQLSIVGFHSDGFRTVDVGQWNLKALTVINAHEKRNGYLLECMRAGLDLIATGQLDMSSLITHRFRLDQVDRAFAAMRDKPEGFIKGVIVL